MTYDHIEQSQCHIKCVVGLNLQYLPPSHPERRTRIVRISMIDAVAASGGTSGSASGSPSGSVSGSPGGSVSGSPSGNTNGNTNASTNPSATLNVCHCAREVAANGQLEASCKPALMDRLVRRPKLS
ncbi:hypothetical protein MBLNU459_g8312t2 [Dothideomycetes sp. NU459]